VELGLIVGPGGINIPAERAYDHVFGYTIINDVSARDVQRRHGGQWFKGKSLDGACPMGPWIVTRDELGRAANLRITLRVNGVTKQDSNTKLLIFDIPAMVSGLSAGLTLEPGDVIATGTPEGVGFARNPRFLRPVTWWSARSRIGVLRNPVGEAAQGGRSDGGLAAAHSNQPPRAPAPAPGPRSPPRDVFVGVSGSFILSSTRSPSTVKGACVLHHADVRRACQEGVDLEGGVGAARVPGAQGHQRACPPHCAGLSCGAQDGAVIGVGPPSGMT
jgi:hypothetical protein